VINLLSLYALLYKSRFKTKTITGFTIWLEEWNNRQAVLESYMRRWQNHIEYLEAYEIVEHRPTPAELERLKLYYQHNLQPFTWTRWVHEIRALSIMLGSFGSGSPEPGIEYERFKAMRDAYRTKARQYNNRQTRLWDDLEGAVPSQTLSKLSLDDSDFRTEGIVNLFHKAARKVTKNSPKVVHYELKNTILRLLKYAHELDDCIASYQHYKLSPGSDSYIWEKWPEVVLSIEKHRERYRKLKQELTNLEQDHPNSYNDWDGVRRHIQKFEDNVREPLRKTLPYHKKQIVELLQDLADKKIKIPLSPPMHASLKENKTGYFLKSRKQSLWNGDIDKELNWLATSRLCGFSFSAQLLL